MNFDAAVTDDLRERVAMAEAFLAAALSDSRGEPTVIGNLPPELMAMLIAVRERHVAALNSRVAIEMAMTFTLEDLQAARDEYVRRVAWNTSTRNQRMNALYHQRVEELTPELAASIERDTNAAVTRFTRGE